MTNSDLKIYQAPLQGLTDFTFRNIHHKHFNHVDGYFTPYLVFENDGSIKKSRLNEILPENNCVNHVTPQILVKNSAETQRMIDLIKHYNYRSININLGCPYPMVTKRGRGSALLQNPETLKEILHTAFNYFEGDISVKMRCGLTDFSEQTPIIELLNDFPIKQLFLHPRIAKQLYKGTPDISAFITAKEKYNTEIIYNGDINSIDDFDALQNKIGSISALMIGRGLLQHPQLAKALKTDNNNVSTLVLRSFHEDLFNNYRQRLSGDGHLLQKMRQFWEYFSAEFPTPKKVYKTIKKANNSKMYDDAVSKAFILRNEVSET